MTCSPRYRVVAVLFACVSALAVNLPIPAEEAARIELPAGKGKPVDPYSRLVAELDAATQESSTEIIEIAKELGDEFAVRLAKLELARTGPPPGQLLETVQVLGEISSRLEAAEQWAEFTLRDERIRHAAAKRHVKARNAAELRRAYAEYQWQLMARQVAAHKLWKLATGRARVEAVETYTSSYGSSSTTRNATYAETLQFANQLRAQAYARINVQPPRKTRLVQIYDIHRLAARAEQKTAVKRLSKLVDSELENFAEEHLGLVKRAMNGSDRQRQRALLSLGWWNELEGHRLLDESLIDDSELIRQAAIAALGRWHHNSLSLAKYAEHKQPHVRRAAAELAAQQLSNIPRVLGAIRELFWDEEEEVRAQAYFTLDQLSRLGNRGVQPHLRFAALPLKSTSNEVILDAVHWLTDCGDNSDQRLIYAKLKLLHPLQRHHNGDVRTAANKACNGLYVAKN